MDCQTGIFRGGIEAWAFFAGKIAVAVYADVRESLFDYEYQSCQSFFLRNCAGVGGIAFMVDTTDVTYAY